MLDVNLKGTFLVAKAFLPAMLAAKTGRALRLVLHKRVDVVGEQAQLGHDVGRVDLATDELPHQRAVVPRARGEWLLFTDADTCHDPLMLRDSIAAATATHADLLSGMPHQIVKTWSEQLLVPILAWSFMAFIPIALAQRVRAAFLSIAIGQYLLFRRSAYEKINGHASVRDKVVEDFELARNIKKAGLQWRFIDVTSRIHCRMYHNFREVFNGLSKNLFAVFGNLFFFALAWSALIASFR